MIMEPFVKINKWIDSILSDKLEIVSKEMKELEKWNIDVKSNKQLFKALLYLAHTADRAKVSDIQIGKQIYVVTDCICYFLVEIPDLMKYYSCLYHIIRKLIAIQLYSEAMKVTVFTFPSNLVHGLTTPHFDMYPKIAALWHEAALDVIDSSPKGLSDAQYKLSVECVEYELKVLEVVAKERTTLVLTKIFRYLLNLDTVTKNDIYRTAVNKFFGKISVSLVGKEKYDIYQDALRFINLRTSTTRLCVENARADFLNRCETVEKIISQDEELTSCFLLYKNMGIMLFKPVENSPEISHWNFNEIKEKTLSIMYNFKRGKGIFLNMKMISYILQTLLDHWESCISNSDPRFLNSAVLRDILNLLKLMFHILNSIETENCENCRGNICSMKKHTFSVTVVSVRYLIILSKMTAGDLLKDILKLMQELLEENVAAIFEMKECDCPQWSGLWNNCGINIYNLSVTCYKTFYEETVYLFSLLCSCVVKFEGINAVNSLLAIKNPLSYSLHKLSGVHFNHRNYREALTPCALNGLLSYQNSDTKAFRMWTSIKNASTNSHSLLEITMLSCLREDMNVLSEIGVDVNLMDYDLKELCLQELRGLYESRCNMSLAMYSILDELDALDSSDLTYAQGVQLLGIHQLHYDDDENFLGYFKRAMKKLNKNEVETDLHVLIAASLCFFAFIIDLRDISKQTKAEMDTAKFALKAVKSNISGSQPKSDNVVPAYTEINVTRDSKLFSQLKQALDKWSLCGKKNLLGIVPEWYLALTLRTLVIAGEYSRLHGFSTLETKAWQLCFNLAKCLNDSRTCVYAIGRSMSLRQVNSQWINTGNNLTSVLESSNDPEANNATASFWVGLLNFYFKIGKHEEAADILRRVLALPNINPMKNISYYLSTMDSILRNYHLCSNENRNIKYMAYMVKCLYSMVALMECSPSAKIGKEKQLHSLEVLFTSTSHLSLRMNSLLSFKEISSHLVNRLKLSQASGITLRVAECLKNLCFIDLSRMQLDDCVVKLQGLEYILQTEYINESRNTKNPQTSVNEFNKPGARDTQVRDSSPTLRKTVFKLPDFITHVTCSCYKCSSVDYQYLVLSNTHIRAQLYFLQGHLVEALEHFSGVFFLRRALMKMEMKRNIASLKFLKQENTKLQRVSRALYHTVEYVLLLLDFSRLIRELGDDDCQDGMKLAEEAVSLCEKFHLVGHTVYIAAKELVLEYHFCRTMKDVDFQKFTVPDASSIDIDKFMRPVSVESSAITTPAPRQCVTKPKTIRRNRTPPLLKLTKVAMDLSDDDDDEVKIDSPKSSRYRTKSSSGRRVPKLVKGKNLEKYLDSASSSCSINNETDTGDEDIQCIKIPAQVNNDWENFSQVVNRAALVFPQPSREFDEVLENKAIKQSQKIKQLIQLVQRAEQKTKPHTYGRKNKNKNSNDRDHDDIVNEIVNAFNEIIFKEQDLPSDSNFSDNNYKPFSSMNNFTPSFDAKEFRTPRIYKMTKKRLEFCDYPGSESSNEFEKVPVIPRPEYSQDKERLRTSDRSKKSRPIPDLEKKTMPRQEIKGLQDRLKISVVKTEKLDEKNRNKKQNSGNVQRITKSASESSIDIVEDSWLNDSEIIPSSDVDENVKSAEQKNGVAPHYKTSTSSRISRSKSQTTTRTTPGWKIPQNIDGGPISDPEDSSQTAKRKTCEPKRITRATSKMKKSDSQLTQISNSAENETDLFPKISQSVAKDELEAPVKKQTSKRPTSGSSKNKR